MLAEFGEFLEKIIASTWNMLNSSSPWIIFSFLVAGLLHEFLKPEKIQKTAIGKMKFSMRNAGNLYWQSSWQKDDRQENRIRRLGSDIPAVSLHLNSLQNSLCWKLNYNSWQTEVGGQIMFIDNHSQAGTGIVPVIPNYTETQMGIYGIGKYNYSKGGIEAGIRFDGQETRASGYDWTGSLYGGTRKFNNVSYSLGGHHHFSDQWKLTTNFGLAWRAPHVYELYSNGNELGSGMFVKGDSTMHSERSYKWISSISYSNKVFSAIPNTTAAPSATRLPAPAPVAKSNGITPNTNASDVIRIGRRRICPA